MREEYTVFMSNPNDMYEYKVMHNGDTWYAYRNKEFTVVSRRASYNKDEIHSTLTYEVESRVLPFTEWKKKKKKGYFDLGEDIPDFTSVDFENLEDCTGAFS